MSEPPEYQVWHTVTPMTFDDFLVLKDSIIPLSHDHQEDALVRAGALHTRGLIVHLIEGGDGTFLTRAEILDQIAKRGRALDGRPRKY